MKKRRNEKQDDELVEALDKSVDFYFAINPTYATRWVASTNQYAIANAILMHEERIRSSQRRELVDFMKWGTFFILLAMAFFIIVSALSSGGGGVPLGEIIGV